MNHQPRQNTTTGPSVYSMNAWERQQVFREMVVHQLKQGALSRRRRKNIVQYAACLGVTPTLAGRLIREAHRDFEMMCLADAPTLRIAPADPAPHERRWRAIFGIAVGAVMLNSWLIMRFLG